MSGHLSWREGGEVRPKRPTVGKEKPGITISGVNDGRDPEPTNRVIILSESVCKGVMFERPLRGSTVMRQKECRLSGFTCADR
jgi:hypothetical protein